VAEVMRKVPRADQGDRTLLISMIAGATHDDVVAAIGLRIADGERRKSDC
jgi:hypothetical protein